MSSLHFKRTTKDLGPLGSAYLSVGYQKVDGTDVWDDVPMTNDQARLDLPDATMTFVARCQILGDAGGLVELEVRDGERLLEPSFQREIEPTEAGRTFLAYRVYAL